MRIHFTSGLKPLAAALCFSLVLPMEALAEQDNAVPTQLNVVVVEGDGAVSGARQRVLPEPSVRVENENHVPVVGAAVVFTLPTEGATGEFANGDKTLTIMTDNRGVAAARGLRLNAFPGKIPVHVIASYKGLSTRLIFTLESVLPPGAKPPSVSKGGSGKIIVILALVGAAAAGGAVAATHKGSTSSTTTTVTSTSPTPIGINAGTGSITGGH